MSRAACRTCAPHAARQRGRAGPRGGQAALDTRAWPVGQRRLRLPRITRRLEGGTPPRERASARPASAEERKPLRRIGDEPVITTLTFEDAGTKRQIDVAARGSDGRLLLGPYAESRLVPNESAAP